METLIFFKSTSILFSSDEHSFLISTLHKTFPFLYPFPQCYAGIKFFALLFAFHRCTESRISGITMHSVREKKRSSVKSGLYKCRGFAAGIISILHARSFILPGAMLWRRGDVRLRALPRAVYHVHIYFKAHCR